MDSAAFWRLRIAFEACLELPPAERDEHLVATIGDAPELLARARAMLAADERTDGAQGTFLASPGPLTALTAARSVESPPLEAGITISGFTLIRLLGRGGMGEVWEAQEQHPKRRVALKVLHSGQVSGGGTRARQRFEDEVEMLARLEHPGIARVLAAGIWTPDEQATPRPWFALELVHGAQPLTAFAAGLPLEEKLGLLIEVCDAVHHGHLRGVVHRDLKPANIPVGLDGRVRVIDFGIAHAAGEGAAGAMRHTQVGELVGTLGYMAPEQIQGRASVIDARADVFALGVLLYELLTGQTPWRAESSSWAALALEVTERDPAPPSLHQPGLSRELDWIFARATEKEPDRRYASAHELGTEIKRFLNHESLTAGPPSAAYRVAKFARRNRALVGGTVLVLLLAIGGAAGTTWGWMRSLDREERLQEAEAYANERATRAQALNSFLDNMLRAANPLADQAGLANDTSLADMLLGAADQVDGAFPGNAALEADMRQLIGVALHGQGRYSAAVEQLEAAWRGYEELGDGHTRQQLQTRRHLAVALARAGSAEAGLEHLRAAWARAKSVLGVADEETTRLESDLAWVLLELGHSEEALIHARAALEQFGSPGSNSASAGAATCVAQALRDSGHPEGVGATQAAYAEAVERAQASFGPDSVQAGITSSNLGAFFFGQGQLEQALACFEEALRLQRAALGPDNAYLTTPLYNLATVQQKLGLLEESLANIEECLALCTRTWGQDHPTTLEALQARADVLWWLERFDDAQVDFTYCAEVLGRDPAQHDRAVMMELRALEMRCFGTDTPAAATARVELLKRIEQLGKEESESSELHGFAERTWSRVVDHLGA